MEDKQCCQFAGSANVRHCHYNDQWCCSCSVEDPWDGLFLLDPLSSHLRHFHRKMSILQVKTSAQRRLRLFFQPVTRDQRNPPCVSSAPSRLRRKIQRHRCQIVQNFAFQTHVKYPNLIAQSSNIVLLKSPITGALHSVSSQLERSDVQFFIKTANFDVYFVTFQISRGVSGR